MKSIKGLKGVVTALVSPMKSDGSLDLESFKRLLKSQARAKVSGVVVCGTTGESPTLDTYERLTLLETALAELAGTRIKVLMGTGSNDTKKTIEATHAAQKAGADGALIVTPYYNKPAQHALIKHFTTVAESVPLEIMLYNVPGRTAVTMAPDTIATLAKHKRIVALKEAGGSCSALSDIQDALIRHGAKLDIFCGDDSLYLPMRAMGAVGVVSVASNIMPKALRQLESAGAQAAQAKYYPIFRDLFIESNPVPVKKALEYIGICEAHVRPPLAPLSQRSHDVFMTTLKSCGFKKDGGAK